MAMPDNIDKSVRHDSAIEFLAKKSQRPIDDVASVYGKELIKLAVGAHITAFLPIFAFRQARELLRLQNIGKTAPA